MPPAERSIEQVTAELKMLAGRQVTKREDKFLFVADMYRVILSMNHNDWQEFQKERNRSASDAAKRA